MIWAREQTLRHGRVWKFKTAPADPVDTIRGRYIALRLAAEEIPAPAKDETRSKIPAGTVVYLTLKEDADGFTQVDRISPTPLKGDNVMKAQSSYWFEHTQHVHFPFDRLWVSEKVAPEAERAYVANNRRNKQNAYVTVRVRDGDAALGQLYIDNQPLVDYLRARSPR